MRPAEAPRVLTRASPRVCPCPPVLCLEGPSPAGSGPPSCTQPHPEIPEVGESVGERVGDAVRSTGDPGGQTDECFFLGRRCVREAPATFFFPWRRWGRNPHPSHWGTFFLFIWRQRLSESRQKEGSREWGGRGGGARRTSFGLPLYGLQRGLAAWRGLHTPRPSSAGG